MFAYHMYFIKEELFINYLCLVCLRRTCPGHSVQHYLWPFVCKIVKYIFIFTLDKNIYKNVGYLVCASQHYYTFITVSSIMLFLVFEMKHKQTNPIKVKVNQCVFHLGHVTLAQFVGGSLPQNLNPSGCRVTELTKRSSSTHLTLDLSSYS